MKAVRGAEISLSSLNLDKYEGKDLREELKKLSDERLFTVFASLKAGVSVDEIFEITKIDRWFLSKLNNLVEYERRLHSEKLTRALYDEGKRLGYPDHELEKLSGQKIPQEGGL